MAVSMICPLCKARVSTKLALNEGAKIPCTNCKNEFAASDDNREKFIDEVAPTHSKDRETVPSAPRSRDNESANRSRRRDDEFETRRTYSDDDLPRSRRRQDDDDSDRSRTKRDDNSPRSRHRDDNDGNLPYADRDDDRPRSRRRQDEDDRPRTQRDDDSPRVPRRADEEDYYDSPRPIRNDGPPRSRQREFDDNWPRQTKNRKPIGHELAVAMVGAGLVVFLLIIFTLLYFLSRDRTEVSYDPTNKGDMNQDEIPGNGQVGAIPNDGGNRDGFAAPNLLPPIARVPGPAAPLPGVVVPAVPLPGPPVFGVAKVPLSQLLPFAPAETAALFAVDIEQVLTIPKLKPLLAKTSFYEGLQQWLPDLQKSGLTEDDFAKVMIAMTDLDDPNADAAVVIAIRFKRNLDKRKIIDKLEMLEQRKKGKSYYTKDQDFFYFPAADTIVITQDEATIEALLNKPPGQIAIDSNMAALAERTGDGQVVVVGGKELIKSAANLKGVGGLANNNQEFQKAKGFAAWGSVIGNDLHLAAAIKVEDALTASRFAEQRRQEWQAFKANPQLLNQFAQFGIPGIESLLKEMVNSYAIGSKDDGISISTKFTFQLIVDLFQNAARGAAPGMPGFPNIGPMNPGMPNPGFPQQPAIPMNPGRPNQGPPQPPRRVFPRPGLPIRPRMPNAGFQQQLESPMNEHRS